MSPQQAGTFVDSAQIRVRAGDGGDGSASFRREPFIPHGGPNGGDGGRGGSVIAFATTEASSLNGYSGPRSWRAGDGRGGEGGLKAGKAGADLRLPVPLGTLVFDAAGGRLMRISLTLNGRQRTADIEEHHTLLDALRDDLGLTGAKECCLVGECGACTIRLNGRVVDSCLVLAVEADGGEGNVGGADDDFRSIPPAAD